jgi:hypothetical protein
LQAHVETFYLNVLRISDSDWTAVSGRRAKILSIDAACNDFLADRPGGSMKLLLCIAKSFAVESWRYIMGNGQAIGVSPEAAEVDQA